MPEVKNKSGKVFDLYQLQIEGLKKGWLIYPCTLEPLSLIVKRKEHHLPIDTMP